MNGAALTGRSREHLASLEAPPCVLHGGVVVPFLKLREAAARNGFDLTPVSGFRDFERQLAIWNGKFTGARALFDANGNPLETLRLSAAERVAAILVWSALPGASRHHWGTDLDLIDAAAVPVGYRVQLTAAEFAPDGPFGRLSRWLEEHAARYGFFRPYRGRLSGVAAEPWHFSFAPIAEYARRRLTPAVLADALETAPLEGKALVLERLDELHARYVDAIDPS